MEPAVTKAQQRDTFLNYRGLTLALSVNYHWFETYPVDADFMPMQMHTFSLATVWPTLIPKVFKTAPVT